MAKHLPMTDANLLSEFRAAKNKRQQVEILADLCLCAPFVVAERLEWLGAFEGTELRAEEFSNQYKPIQGVKPKRGRPKKQETPPAPPAPLDELRAMELWNEGLDDISMADSLGVSVARIRKWRSRMHLLRPRVGYLQKPKEAESMTDERKQTEANSETVETVETAEPETAPETAAEQAHAPELLTVKAFLAVCTDLLTPRAAEASLYLNGAPVRAVSQICIKARGGVPCVDIVTEG